MRTRLLGIFMLVALFSLFVCEQLSRRPVLEFLVLLASTLGLVLFILVAVIFIVKGRIP